MYTARIGKGGARAINSTGFDVAILPLTKPHRTTPHRRILGKKDAPHPTAPHPRIYGGNPNVEQVFLTVQIELISRKKRRVPYRRTIYVRNMNM